MNVGDYARDEKGIIGRIEQKEYDKRYLADFYWFKGTWCLKEYFVKSSQNIIDLVQEGDYVNGGLVTMVDIGIKDCDYIMVALPDYEECQEIRNDDIETIVTKEQFESVKYRIGEK